MRNGFTLIEVLVALTVLALTGSVVLESQLVSLKIEQRARSLQLFRFETQRIFSVSRRAANELELIRLLPEGALCRAKAEPVQLESGTNITELVRYELFADNERSFSSVFFIHAPVDARAGMGGTNAPAAGINASPAPGK